MKKFFLLFFLLSACSSLPEFYVRIQNNLNTVSKDKTFYYIGKGNETIDDLRISDALKNAFIGNGYKITENILKANAFVSFYMEQDKKLMTGYSPHYGRTGINSINTYTYGNYSTSNVNYNYGITGYTPYSYYVYTTCLNIDVRKLGKKIEKIGEQIYYAKICGDGTWGAQSAVFLVNNIFMLYLNSPDMKVKFECSNITDQEYGYCKNIGSF